MLMRLAKKTADNLFKEAELASESERKEIPKFAHGTENDATLRAMIKQAISEEEITLPC